MTKPASLSERYFGIRELRRLVELGQPAIGLQIPSARTKIATTGASPFSQTRQ